MSVIFDGKLPLGTNFSLQVLVTVIRLSANLVGTIIGKRYKSVIVTLVERKSSLILMRKLKSKNSAHLATETMNLLAPYKAFVHSITSSYLTLLIAHS